MSRDENLLPRKAGRDELAADLMPRPPRLIGRVA